MCLKSNAFGLIEDDSTHPYFRMWSCYRRRCPKDIGMYACRKNEEIGRLTASIAEKDKTIVELTEERETMKLALQNLKYRCLLMKRIFRLPIQKICKRKMPRR